MKFLVEEQGKFEESLYQFFYQFLSVLWMQTIHTNVIKGPFLRYHASVSWLPMSTVHATEAWTLKNGVLMTFVFCMEDLQVEFFHCGLWVLLFFITHWMVGNRIPVRDIYVGIYLTKYLLIKMFLQIIWLFKTQIIYSLIIQPRSRLCNNISSKTKSLFTGYWWWGNIFES